MRGETLILLAVVLTVPFALSHRIHTRDAQGTGVAIAGSQPAWTGRIAELPAGDTAKANDVITSASLVVAPSTLALPGTMPRAQVKGHPCTPDEPCTAKAAASGQKQRVAMIARSGQSARRDDETGFLHHLNPLEHLPETVRRPFDNARAVLTGWFRQL